MLLWTITVHFFSLKKENLWGAKKCTIYDWGYVFLREGGGISLVICQVEEAQAKCAKTLEICW